MIDLRCGDAREIVPQLAEASVDAIVTDPPYGLRFMGKRWDHDVPPVEVWAECLRVLKPGGHLLAFGGTRTYHRLVCAIEDAGFEIRDQLQWLYGSGFPKSLNLRDDWKGWGTALKPANEPICLARKPLVGTVTENVQQYGTGALNVDGCRLNPGEAVPGGGGLRGGAGSRHEGWQRPSHREARATESHAAGRWPANVLLDEEAARMLDEQSGILTSGVPGGARNVPGVFSRNATATDLTGYGDSGGASRFFYCAKASRRERGEGNTHPTVKPVALMRHLVRLVTPPSGLVLDPYLGSGTTGVAALAEGLRFVGIEREPEYLEIARRRIESTQPALAA